MALNFANNSSLANITSLPASVSGGGLTLVSSQTASASASLEFSMDSTYDVYVFKFINIHGSASGQFKCNFSIDNGSNYNVTKTTTSFVGYHTEADDYSALVYQTSRDLAQSTSDMWLSSSLGTDNDQCFSGYMKFFNPSSSVYVKHFLTRGNSMAGDPASVDDIFAGYCNTTSPITNVKFLMSSGNIDDGIIKMYGVA